MCLFLEQPCITKDREPAITRAGSESLSSPKHDFGIPGRPSGVLFVPRGSGHPRKIVVLFRSGESNATSLRLREVALPEAIWREELLDTDSC